MNKQNEFYQNEVSTGIQDSWEKSTYSSRFYKSQNKTHLSKKHLPSKYEKAAIFIQRRWRFYQYMKRRVCVQVIQQLSTINSCYSLQNRILEQLVNRYQNIISFNQSLLSNHIKSSLSDFQFIISQTKKQCVISSFKLQKKTPNKQLLSQLIHQKQEQKQMNLMLNREKLIIQEELDHEKKQYEVVLQQYKRLNQQHLQLTKQKNQLAHKNAQKLLQTSKFGIRHQSIQNQNINRRGKTFIVDFFQETQPNQ